MSKNTNKAHIILKNVRLSYVHLTEAYSMNGGNPKYSCTILIPKSDPINKQNIDEAVKAATEYGISKYGNTFPVNPKVSVHDGDGVRPSDGLPYGKECNGCYVLTASSKEKPRVVDGNLQDIIDPTEIYSGMWANVSVTFFPYSTTQNKGIGAGLENIQKVADGETLGGGHAKAEDDFSVIN